MSFTFANLPGVQVVTVDGGLAAVNTPTTKSILVLGTSAIGPANSPFQVVSLAAAAKAFGLNGTLTRGMAECAAYCDNIQLFRAGTSQGSILVGHTSAPVSGPVNTLIDGTRLGGVITLTVVGHVTPDVVPGSSIVITGFAVNTDFNATWTALTVVTGVTNDTITIDDIGFADEAIETIGALFHVTTPAQNGFAVLLGQVDANADSRYKVWYAAGLLSIWLDNNLVYSNDPSNNGPLNTGDVEVTGTSSAGTAIGSGADTLADAITIAAEVVAVPAAINYVPPVDGIGMLARDLYTAQQNAMDLLQGMPVDFAVVPGALADQANVALLADNASRDNLDYLWTGVDVNGNAIYQWASENQFITSDNRKLTGSTLLLGSVAATPTALTITSASQRLSAGVGAGHTIQPSGFHEVNFAYQLARFCAAQSEAPQADNGGCLGFIGTHGPASLSDFTLSAVRKWIGFLPTYDPVTGLPATPGSGLLGIPFLVGGVASQFDDDASNRSPRLPGLFATASGEYDGGSEIDANGFKVDIGAYIAVQGDYCIQSNGYGTYVGNIAGLVAGLVSSLDQQKAVTNKQLAGASQLYRASLSQLDSLTQADVNMLRYKGIGALPVALHDKTAAAGASDYTLQLRQRIKFLVIQTLLSEAQHFIGNSTNDGLALTALKTALDADLLTLQKRGYLQSFRFTITSTKAQQKVGQASIQISFVPANELVQLNATVGINLA